MATTTLGIVVNGATGRIASTQHLEQALLVIRNAGGLQVGDQRVIPRLLLVGRDKERVSNIAQKLDIPDWTTDLDGALSDSAYSVVFDGAVTHQRETVIEKAIAAKKHIYVEKPVAPSVKRGAELLRAAESRNLKHGAVEDKIYLPGLQKLSDLMKNGFFGRVIGFRLDFGWWVFDGEQIPCQRPSWNYQKAAGGGLLLDMYPHWRYILEEIIGRIRRVVSASSTATPERVDETGKKYDVDVDDTSSTIVELENGAFGTIISSWATRVRRDDVFTLQIDGTNGSALGGFHRCWAQPMATTPHARWNPNFDMEQDFRKDWKEVPPSKPYRNGYLVGWENFIRHLVADAPFKSTMRAGIRDVQLAEACYESFVERRWIDLVDLP
jgi:predicted dehydrogenase